MNGRIQLGHYLSLPLARNTYGNPREKTRERSRRRQSGGAVDLVTFAERFLFARHVKRLIRENMPLSSSKARRQEDCQYTPNGSLKACRSLREIQDG
jgi:hypothetical protein